MGAIKGQWMNAEQKEEIMAMIEWAKEKGISVTRTCALLMISRRRVIRWRKKPGILLNGG